jgi:hypothetical protein
MIGRVSTFTDFLLTTYFDWLDINFYLTFTLFCWWAINFYLTFYLLYMQKRNFHAYLTFVYFVARSDYLTLSEKFNLFLAVLKCLLRTKVPYCLKRPIKHSL